VDDQTEHLLTEGVRPDRSDLDLLSPTSLVALAIQELEPIGVALAEAAHAMAHAIERIEPRFSRGGRLIYVGAGTAGRLGVLDASECVPTFGVEPGRVVGIIAGGPQALWQAVEDAEDDPAAGVADIDAARVEPDDCVVGISASGRTPYVVGALQRARARGALVVSITNSPAGPVARCADVAVEILVGAELVAGSTRLKAGTAQKIALNALSTAILVRAGHAYGNLMVGLQPANEKLRHRAVRIVASIGGVTAEVAEKSLSDAGGEVKTAIVALRRGVDMVLARRLLDETSGRLRPVIDHPNGG
jgi:N-acetylmuramic acid 6-phosphate etherase